MATFLNITVDLSSYGHLGFCAACGTKIEGTRAVQIFTKGGVSMNFDRECAEGFADLIHQICRERRLPLRVQLSRRKGFKMPPNSVKVDRSTPYGNPHRLGQIDSEGNLIKNHFRAVALFREYATARLRKEPNWLLPLRGRNLACWCGPAQFCHADVLIELANP